MKKSKKIKRIEKLFEGGEIDIFKLLDFLIEYGEEYRKLEFLSSFGECLRIYDKHNSKFMDLVNSKRDEVISSYPIKCYSEIFQLARIRNVDLLGKKWSIFKVID